jgi:chromosome segregation ATPase
VPTEILFFGQIASVVIFLGALFSVYRSLAAQKDATIQVLKEKNELLKLQLEHAKSQAPDVAVEALSRRLNSLTEELSRLQQDASANADTIAGKERELESAKEEMNQLREQVARAEKLFDGFSCPKCKAPMETREYHSEMVEYNGRELDIDHELVTYECGLEFSDGRETRPCGSR